jgi:hypothetical protein
MQTAAFRSLSVGARALLLELKALYNGNNNGALFFRSRGGQASQHRQEQGRPTVLRTAGEGLHSS